MVEVSRSLRHRAKEALEVGSVDQAHTGSVLFIQRFDSALRLNVHGHLLSLDGAYVRGADDALVFHELVEPSAEEVAEVARRTAMRLVEVPKKHGREVDPELSEVDVSADDSAEHSALSSCYAAAAAGTDSFGQRAGSPALRLVDPSLARPHEPVAIAYGVNVHAAVRVHENDRAQLERLCRYLGWRPGSFRMATGCHSALEGLRAALGRCGGRSSALRQRLGALPTVINCTENEGNPTAAAKAGKSERSIMQQTGHHLVSVVRSYIRDAELFEDNAAPGIGL